MIDWNVSFTPTYPGWIPPEERDTDTQKAHERFLDETPTVDEVFRAGSSNPNRPRVWEVARQAIERGYIPQEWVRNGNLKNVAQITGSCVGFGAANMALYASIVDAMIRMQSERIVVPFFGYHYGRGRLHSGIRGRGDGSTGSGQAKALKEDGFLPFDFEGVPRPNFGDAIHWTRDQELQWSDGARIEQRFLDEGRKHLFPTVALLENTDQAAQLCDSFYTFTIASSWGGQMRCPVVEGVLLNRRSGTWNHQMSVLDYLQHPSLGRIWYVFNQWRYPHGVCPHASRPPEGGFWIKDSDLTWIINRRESFGFTDPAGFVDRSRAFDWLVV